MSVLWMWAACWALSHGPTVPTDPTQILPPPTPWSGKTRSLAVAPDHPWATHFEKNDMRTSPPYDAALAWLGRLCEASPHLQMITIGHSAQGRPLQVVVASKDGARDAAALKAGGRPTLFAHAGIHAGEIDGLDAGMMFLRDLTVTGTLSDLLDHANFLFLPILNADGHARASSYNRINQRGPEVMGWRTNGRNRNLNRDFTKLETAGLQALIPFLNSWDPDLYIDIHVTDGIDYQYDITYGFTAPHGYSPAASHWLGDVLRPAVDGALAAAEHIPGPLIFARDNADLSKGIVDWVPSPRYSNGYGDARHLPTILVENHSLKPYDQRVLGTYVFLKAALEIVGKEGAALRKAVAEDRARRPEQLATSFGPSGNQKTIRFLGVASKQEDSAISGGSVVRWLGKPVTLEIPLIQLDKPTGVVRRPKGYFVPLDYTDIIEKLKLHGVALTILDEDKTVEVTAYRFGEPELDKMPFEGRVRVRADVATERRLVTYHPGAAYVSTDQPLGDLAMLLLEPVSVDSFWQWGYFLEVLQATEYFETYAVEPLAAEMLKQDATLKQTFETRLKEDEAFAANPRARLEFFYNQSPFVDAAFRLYPVTRLE